MHNHNNVIAFKSGATRASPYIAVQNAPLGLRRSGFYGASTNPRTGVDDLLNKIITLKKTNNSDDELRPADSTVWHCIEAILQLPNSIPLPELEVDNDGYYELEWYEAGKQFSIYITDRRKAAYAYYLNQNDHGSGYLNVEALFGSISLQGIRRVFT